MTSPARAEVHPFDDRDEIFRREIPSRLDERGPVIDAVLERLEEEGCRPDPFFDRLSLDEILVNAILHGNRQDPEKKVTVRAFRSGDRWGFEVADEGKGFDWKKTVGAGPPADERESGRGLALVLSHADVHFLDGGTRVVVVRPA